MARVVVAGRWGKGPPMPSSQDVAAAEELLRLAIAEPAQAAARAAELLAAVGRPVDAVRGAPRAGLVLRDQGRTAEAVRELRCGACSWLRRSGDPDRLADVRATLGHRPGLGRTHRAPDCSELDRAVAEAVGATSPRPVPDAARLRAVGGPGPAPRGAGRPARRAERCPELGRPALGGAHPGHHVAAPPRRRRGRRGPSGRWRRRAGSSRPRARSSRPCRPCTTRGRSPSAGATCPGRSGCTTRPSARTRGWGEVPVELGRDRCQALLAAGLPDEACAVAADLLARDGVDPVHRAELQLFLALAELGPRRRSTRPWPRRGRRATSFRRQGREVATARAELVVLAARRRAGATGRGLADGAARAGRTARGGAVGGRPGRLAARRPGRGRRRTGRRDGAAGPRPPATAVTPPGWSGPRRGWPRPSTGTGETTCAACGTPAGAGSTRWTTTGPRWAAPSCARSPRCRATSWPGWR